jgi:hypothetical protein
MNTVPSREDFQATLEKARIAAKTVAEKQLEKLQLARPNSDMIDECGTAQIRIYADGRTAWGRFFKSLETEQISNAGVLFDKYNKCFILNLGRFHTGQEVSVFEAALNAAWDIIQNEYGLDGHVHSYSP